MLIGGFSTILLANFAASSFLSKPIKRKSKFQEDSRDSHILKIVSQFFKNPEYRVDAIQYLLGFEDCIV